MQPNAANRKDVRAAEKRAESDLVRLMMINREVICGLMQLGNGREWVWNKLEAGGVFRSVFSPDHSIHAYNDGLRAAAIELFNDIMLYCPDKFNIMMGEAHDRRSTEQQPRSPNGHGGTEGSGGSTADGVDYDPSEDRNDYNPG